MSFGRSAFCRHDCKSYLYTVITYLAEAYQQQSYSRQHVKYLLLVANNLRN
jgi:hypothetical protein